MHILVFAYIFMQLELIFRCISKSIKINFVYMGRIWACILYQINPSCLTPLYGECSDLYGLFQYQSIFLAWFTSSPSGFFTALKLFYLFNPPCMGLSDLSGLFQYQINYPFFLWLILLIPGLYGLRQININYTRLILYSLTYAVFSLLNCLYFLALLSRCCSDLFGIFFTKLFILFSSPFQVLLCPMRYFLY